MIFSKTYCEESRFFVETKFGEIEAGDNIIIVDPCTGELKHYTEENKPEIFHVIAHSISTEQEGQ